MIDLRLIKMITGEILLGTVQNEYNSKVSLINPVTLGVDESKRMQFMPYPMLSEPKKTIEVLREHLVWLIPISQEETSIINHYNKYFGDGTEVILPPTKKLVGV